MSWRRPRTHDPERDAAAYLAGELRGGSVRRFQEHLLGCEDCWTEVRAARRGRAVAESVRELSRPSLRESVRAAVALSAPSDRRRAHRAAITLAVASIVVVASAYGIGRLVVANDQGQPSTITAALAAFRSDRLPAEGPAIRPAPDLSSAGLQLMHSGHGIVGGEAVDVYYYRGTSGARLFLFESRDLFPRASGARDLRGGIGHRWSATEGGLFMLCGDRPVPYLLVANGGHLTTAASEALQTLT
jgi:hypothetical protein